MYAGSYRHVRQLNEIAQRRPVLAQCNSMSADALLPAVEGLLQRGVAAERLEAVFRRRLGDLYEAGLQLPLFQVRRFWVLAEAEGGAPIGWALGAGQSFRALSGLSDLFCTAPSLEKGFQHLQRYLTRFFGHLHLQVTREGRHICVELHDGGALSAPPPAFDYLMAWLCQLVVRRLGGEGAWPNGCELAMGRPACRDAGQYGAGNLPLRWGAERYALYLPEMLFLRALDGADAAQQMALANHFEKQPTSSNGSLIGAVCDYIVSDMRDGPKLETFCLRHRLLLHTVARQLRAQGWSFSLLLDEYRQLLAIDLLQGTGLTQMGVAELLGYQDLSSFHRAFARWYDRSPGDCRVGQPVAARPLAG